MKTILFVLGSAVLGSATAMANMKCLNEAKFQARLHVAKGSELPVDTVRADKWFFHSEESGVLYYGVLVDNDYLLNVGLDKSDCSLVEINYVTGL